MQSESSVPVSSIAKDNEGHRDGVLIRDDNENINVIAHATQNKAINCFRTINHDTHQSVSQTTHQMTRFITFTQLRAKISEYDDLNEKHRDQLRAVVTQYQPHLTKRPGRSTGFEYHFSIVGKLPKSARSSTIPFALRSKVGAQIKICCMMVYRKNLTRIMDIIVLYLYLKLFPYKCFVNSLFICAQELNFLMLVKYGKKNNEIRLALFYKVIITSLLKRTLS
jgi:hypothetical protein